VDTFNYTYSFCFNKDEDIVFNLAIDKHKLLVYNLSPDNHSEWTRLEHNKCKNCSLLDEEYCPVAINLEPIISKFGNKRSYDQTNVEVQSFDRSTSCETTLQRSVSSLLGLVMATSACPHTVFLRPMARFHLPFATDEETIVRASSFYLLSEYFNNDNQNEFDIKLEKLKESYRQLHIVNEGLAERLRTVVEKDAAVNAIILLDLFAKALPYSIDEALSEVNYIFTQ